MERACRRTSRRAPGRGTSLIDDQDEFFILAEKLPT